MHKSYVKKVNKWKDINNLNFNIFFVFCLFSAQLRHNRIKHQEAQTMLTNPRDAFRGQSRSSNMVPFHMLGGLLLLMFMLLCYSNFVRKTRCF